MEKEFAFTFDELSKRQLLKLASAYNVKAQGAMPNDKMELEELKHYPANSTLSVNYYGADPSQPRRVDIALTHLSTNDDSELFSTSLSLDVIKH